MERIIGKEVTGLQNMLARHIERMSVEAGKERISGSNLFILKFIKENSDKDIFQRDLEQVIETTKSTCSKVISTMEGKGLIRRVAVKDARYKKICLTPFGEEVIGIADKYMEDFENNIIQGLTQEQINNFFICIDKIKSNLAKLKIE